MNKKLGLAVAGAILALSSTANAGITIPAGDWTLDIGGVVNAYYTNTRFDRIEHGSGYGGALYTSNGGSDTSSANISTGLLPNYFSISGKSRQNDLDIGFTISMNPGSSTTEGGIQSARQENRQAFLTIGDASWGSVKLGKDLGIYASDAILNDMTLLGVGSGAGGLAGNTTTTGRIGTGYMYADWKSQVAYSSPNWNGFEFTAGITQAWNARADAAASLIDSAVNTSRGAAQTAYEGKASYSWTGDVAGKVWASAISQNVDKLATVADGAQSERANAWDIGANVNAGGFGLTGYYGQGRGIGQTIQLLNGFDQNGKRRDSDQWYVQATYKLPTATKIGIAYGESTLDGNRNADAWNKLEDNMLTVGAYHPLTKSVNLVAEYSQVQSNLKGTANGKLENEAKTVSLGAILFF